MTIKIEPTVNAIDTDEEKVLGKTPKPIVSKGVFELPLDTVFMITNIKNETQFIYTWKQVIHMFNLATKKRILENYPEAVNDVDNVYKIKPKGKK